jgi:hypothetical protein
VKKAEPKPHLFILNSRITKDNAWEKINYMLTILKY